MKNLLLLISLIIIISGCSSKQSTTPSKNKNKFENTLTLDLNKPINQTSIYIDDSLDVKRKEKILDIVYNALKNKEIEALDIHKGIVKTKYNPFSATINLTKVEFQGDKYLNYCLAFCKEKEINPDFVARDNDKIILKNFNSDLEIFSAYKELSWDLFNWSNDYNIRHAYGINVPFKLDKESFSKKEFIVNSDYLNEYSIKTALETYFLKKGFKLVDEKSNADYIFVIENLGFGALDKIKRYIKTPTNLKSTDYFGEMGSIGVLAGQAHTVGGGSGSTGVGIAAGMMAVGLVFNLLDNSGDFIYTFNRVSILDKSKVLKTVFINSPRLRKGNGYLGISDFEIRMTNENAVNSYMSKSFKLNNLNSVQ